MYGLYVYKRDNIYIYIYDKYRIIYFTEIIRLKTIYYNMNHLPSPIFNRTHIVL